MLRYVYICFRRISLAFIIKATPFHISCPFFRATNVKAFPFFLTGCIGVRVHVTDSEGPTAGFYNLVPPGTVLTDDRAFAIDSINSLWFRKEGLQFIVVSKTP